MTDDRSDADRDGLNPDETPAVVDAARKIAAGEAVDWSAVESRADDDSWRALLRGLHDVEGIAAFHREWRGFESHADGGPASKWGSLTIIEEIGRGSFGCVYRAYDPRLDREVALKMLARGPASDKQAARVVINEGRHLARLRHPNIVAIHGVEQVEGQVGLEMELVRGRTLSEILSAQGPFAASEAAVICRDVARALAAVHRTGLTHRDVKAQNVVRERGGRIVLMDFGAGRLADVVESAGLTGTPLYLAPEVLAGASPTPHSDLYSLAVLLYHLVTGSFPFPAATLDELRASFASGKPVHVSAARPGLPERFTNLIERGLAKNPETRIDSAGSFERELSLVLTRTDDRQVTSTRTSLLRYLRR